MSKMVDEKETLESLIAEIQELLNEIKNEQINDKKQAQIHHKVTMKKLDQLREFAEIVDMTNQVFERRLCQLEETLEKILIK